jgi:radical SAM protein with 4Fe4S-binding SPASM domain
MNVAFVNDIAILGGGELWVLKMARALTRRGHQVSILCPHRSQLFNAALEAGIDLFGYTMHGGAPFYEPLYHFLRSRNVDLVYVTVLGRFCEARVFSELVERLGARTRLILKTGLPPMSSFEAEYYGFGAGPAVRALHVVSEENRARFLEWQPGAEQYIRTVREGVDLGYFHRNGLTREQARSQWQVGNSQKLIVSTSRLHVAKGLDNLLLAAHELVNEGRDICVALAGTGAEQQRLESLRDHLGLKDRVRFLGHVNDVRPLLTAADVYCHPSLADGFPNSLVEAMAMEVPVVASAVGGIPEVVHDGETGLLVQPHDVRGIHAALARLLDDDALGLRLAQTAGSSLRSLDFETQVDRWIEAVNEPGVPPPPVHRPATALPVLMLMTHLRTGGEETEAVLLAQHLDRSRFPFSVLSAYPVNEASPGAEKLRALKVQVDTCCHSISDKAGYIVEKIRREQIRIVIASQDTALAYEVFQRLGPSNCRLIEHAGIAGEVHRIPKDFTTVLIAVSKEIAREATPLFSNPARVRALPSMVDLGEFDRLDRDQLRQAYGFVDSIIATFVGRLDAKKGLDHLIEAARFLLPEFPNLRFLIVGPPDGYQIAYAGDLMRRAYAELSKERFTFTGERNDVAAILKASDLLMLPSRGEGMSHVINEAGAARLPVVAYADGAAPEQLEQGRAGMLVPPGDTGALTGALRLLIENPELRTRFGTALRRKVEREYSTGSVMPKWHALLEQVAAGLPSVAPAPALRLIQRDRLLSFPAEIQVETNTACNATCIMCPYPEVSKELPPGRMDLALYEKILSECSGERELWRIEPFLNNEPFTDTRMVDWIVLAKQRVPHAMITVTTNGSLVTPKVTDRLIHSGLDGIWFSFNGATRETYEKIMGLSWDKVKANIDYLLDHKPASLRVFTNMIETEPMRGEIADNIRYWHSRGVQSGSSPLVNRAGNVTNFVELNYRKHADKPVRLCELLYHKMYIGYNGDVLLCCMDWRRRVVLGNVRTQSLREVWLGEKYQTYRRLHEEGRSAELDLCNSCSYINA